MNIEFAQDLILIFLAFFVGCRFGSFFHQYNKYSLSRYQSYINRENRKKNIQRPAPRQIAT